MKSRLKPFVNRVRELEALKSLQSHGGLVVFYGRRRVGKTRLLMEWLTSCGGLYTQAIEGSADLQIHQIYQDLAPHLSVPIQPKTWSELFALLDAQKTRLILCVDEFPYLVQSDSTLPSLIQKWWDHRKKKNILLVLCGSSRKMMMNSVLSIDSPLYGRADKIIQVYPMGYLDFCRAMGLNAAKKTTFTLFTVVGGLPKYWELLTRPFAPLSAAEELFFGYSAYMENEPRRLLADEQISGVHAVSILEAIGRGAEKPSEIAGRMGIPHTQLVKVFYPLLDAALIKRDIPFGQSEKNPKNVLYKIIDPSLRFWFRTYSPHKSRWFYMNDKEKNNLINIHASSVFEDFVRDALPQARRYWFKDVEFDALRLEGKKTLVLSEIKFSILSDRDKSDMKKSLLARWARVPLSQKFPVPKIEIFDQNYLTHL